MSKIVLRNCRVIPELTEGYAGDFADILIEDRTIAGVHPPGLDFGRAEYIDAEKRTIVPGLFDLHVHLMSVNRHHTKLGRSQNQYLLDCVQFAQSYLRHGYTTIRDCGSDYYCGVAVRDAVNAEKIAGPRIITSGKILTPVARGNKTFGTLYEEFDRPEDASHCCRQEMANGVDFIKYMVTGAVMNQGGLPGAMVCTPEEIAAVTKASRSLGTYVAAHCHGKEGIKQSVLNGVYTIEHATYIDEECIDLIHQKGDFSVIIPTLGLMNALVNHLYKGTLLEEFITKAAVAYEAALNNIRLAFDGGVMMGWGTDMDMELFEAYPALEFITRRQLGLSNVELLRQATINSAKIVGMEDQLGTIKAGKLADILVVDGNPKDDIEALSQIPYLVFKEGKRVSQ